MFTRSAGPKDHRGVDLISDAMPFGRLRYENTGDNRLREDCSRSHDAMICVL